MDGDRGKRKSTVCSAREDGAVQSGRTSSRCSPVIEVCRAIRRNDGKVEVAATGSYGMDNEKL